MLVEYSALTDMRWLSDRKRRFVKVEIDVWNAIIGRIRFFLPTHYHLHACIPARLRIIGYLFANKEWRKSLSVRKPISLISISHQIIWQIDFWERRKKEISINQSFFCGIVGVKEKKKIVYENSIPILSQFSLILWKKINLVAALNNPMRYRQMRWTRRI